MPTRIVATAVALVAVLVSASPAAAERTRFDTGVFALVPSPGFPAQAYVAPTRRVYASTFTNPGGDDLASRVFEFSARGKARRSWEVNGQVLHEDQGVQVATSDAGGRLVLLDRFPARVLLLDPRTGVQQTYAAFPGPAAPDHAAWGRRGELYVTDAQHAIIWRIPAGGGVAEMWLRSPALQGADFGTTGLELAPDRRHLLFATRSSAARSLMVAVLIVRVCIVARSDSSIWAIGRCRETSTTASPQPKSSWRIRKVPHASYNAGHSDRYDRKQTESIRLLRLLHR